MPFQKEDLMTLEQVDNASKFAIPEIGKYLSTKFSVKMSLYGFQLLLHFCKLNQFVLLMRILNGNINFLLSSDKNKIDLKGAFSLLVNEDLQEVNSADLTLGKLPEFCPEFASTSLLQTGMNLAAGGLLEGDASHSQAAAGDKAAEQQIKKNKRTTQNILIQPQIPMPRLSENLQAKILAEMNQQVKLSEKVLPSIAQIDVYNTFKMLTAITLSDTGNIMVCGFQDSSIKVFIFDPDQLDNVTSRDIDPSKGANQPRKGVINTTQGVISFRESKLEKLKERAQKEFILIGHSGPVYGVSVSIDEKWLLSCSQDCTIRLWSLGEKTLTSIFHGHSYPIWQVKFSSLGSYFVSCSNDRTAKLWQTKQHIPLRIFTGHLSDIDCVEFHPNIHYIATGSNDKQVRLWSCLTGECVRIMVSVAGTVRSLKFSRSGNHLFSGNDYGEIVIFDVSKGQPIEIIDTYNQRAIWALDISWDDSILCAGTEEGTIEMFNFQKVLNQAAKLGNA
jgi:transcription initiation factor TFIID subunit 5